MNRDSNTNQLTGTIPTELENIENLFDLLLANNYWDCPVNEYYPQIIDYYSHYDYDDAKDQCGKRSIKRLFFLF